RAGVDARARPIGPGGVRELPPLRDGDRRARARAHRDSPQERIATARAHRRGRKEERGHGQRPETEEELTAEDAEDAEKKGEERTAEENPQDGVVAISVPVPRSLPLTLSLSLPLPLPLTPLPPSAAGACPASSRSE